ncbi:sigma-70 family RNA polymerase sigma factor [Lampropedia puyangensis]|uniref:Sigma-70 family RNA polymerase sigma factor n=1 Tax=Lampropedia puyangensis TaxID=1330072 RepID=A0A4S8F4G5_9BURK|nr:sigma-70 family RNA polymerase sigma factor [Lampropedia puyangensis]THU01939.1 sigma-70 family RNA polymerase sigma factor [Lampropedia puyangensis]
MPALPAFSDLQHPRVETMYREHHAWLQAWLARRLFNRCDAEDLAHDTFERLFTRRDVEDVQEPRALLTTIAKGIVHHFLRRGALEATYLEMLAQWPAEYALSPEEQALLLEELVEIDKRLGRLPPLVRQAFLLAQLDGMRQADIALKLQLSRATVQRYIAQGLHACCFETGD